MLSDNSGRQGLPLKIVCLLMNQYIRLLRCGYVKYGVVFFHDSSPMTIDFGIDWPLVLWRQQ